MRKRLNSMLRQIGTAYPYTLTNASPVYKFVNKEYLESLFTLGDIRLGTLHNFRRTEQHGLNRGDSVEGRNTVRLHVDHLEDPKDGFAKRFLGLGDGCTLSNVSLQETRNWPDAYVFCASTAYSESAFRRWHAEEKTDACYEIFDPTSFARAISQAVQHRAYCSGFAKIDYVDGDIDGATKLHATPAPWIKQRKYDWQTEYRWVWTHKAPAVDVAPKNIVIPDLQRFCRPVARLIDGKIVYLSKDFLDSRKSPA